MGREGRPLLARAIALAVCVVNPITLRALEVGHPEELLGACLCVAAVLLAERDHGLWAGLALGLAIANKEWALLALPPVVLALNPRQRAPCLAVGIGVAAAVLAPLTLVGSGGFASVTRAVASAGSPIFQPWQVWWFLGRHGAVVHGAFDVVKPGYRAGPAWVASMTHPAVLAVGLALGAAFWMRAGTRARVPGRAALLALALVMLVRCLLDSWDTEYYLLPFVLALLAWEVRGPLSRPPALALAACALAWLSFQWLPQHASPDLQAGFFLAWTLPLTAGLRHRLFASHGARLVPRTRDTTLRAQEITVSSLSSPLSTS
jgi:Glycosyltransferase family 87